MLAFSVPTAQAVPPPNPGPPEVTLSVDDSPSPDAVITCTLYASKPNHSGSKVTGTGGISSCAGGTPASCNSEVDVEFYNNYSNQWMTGGSGPRQTKCPPPLRSSSASATCTNKPGDPNTGWRTVTVGTIVSPNGSHDSGTAYSSVLYVPCV
ncbi:hypothetical protein PH213_21365 [Streptomyces sp. SRF1]|uniref:hypothetical protein n=1 Tax=Streptomyces sp. SRF1 TaxID=1549642 RepID=UPI0025B19362|nr:hypothetical protein [Streptomyces sp. SRF1]MDN3057047.1 hypothetical protein [Streptomyces sp. SRF1]